MFGKEMILVDKDSLYSLYIVENKTREEIAAIYNCSLTTVKRKLSKYGIKKDQNLINSSCQRKMIEKYGVPYSILNKSSREKMEKTNLERYREKVYLKSDKARQVISKTNLEKYGSISPFGNKEIYLKGKNNIDYNKAKERREATCLERYGVNNPAKADSIKNRIKETNLFRYGVDNPFKSNIIKERIKKTNLERYSVSNFAKSSLFKDRYREKVFVLEDIEEFSNKEKMKSFLLDLTKKLSRKPHIEDIAKESGVVYSSILKLLNKYELRDLVLINESYLENTFEDFLKSIIK